MVKYLLVQIFVVLNKLKILYNISMEDSDNQFKKQSKTAHLAPFQWKKGKSGNPKGRPKGKTLKEFAREYLESLPDSEKLKYLSSLPLEITWKMAEGNPETKTDLTTGGKPIGHLLDNVND